jgi:hypothetical protein
MAEGIAGAVGGASVRLGAACSVLTAVFAGLDGAACFPTAGAVAASRPLLNPSAGQLRKTATQAPPARKAALAFSAAERRFAQRRRSKNGNIGRIKMTDMAGLPSSREWTRSAAAVGPKTTRRNATLFRSRPPLGPLLACNHPAGLVLSA